MDDLHDGLANSKMMLPAFLVDLMYRFNIMDIIRPAVMKIMSLVIGEANRDLDQLERMKSPRVLKSHLPLYLLHPELLDTSKVSRRVHYPFPILKNRLPCMITMYGHFLTVYRDP